MNALSFGRERLLSASCNAPLIRLRHLHPPKSTGGDGARLEGVTIAVREMRSQTMAVRSSKFPPRVHGARRTDRLQFSPFLDPTLQSSAFSPTLLWGRRWRSRMRGRLTDETPLHKRQAPDGCLVNRARRGCFPQSCNAPLIRLRHLLPPKSTGGEGARLEGVATG